MREKCGDDAVNHYPHHIGDFDKSTRHLTRIERSIYRDLIEIYYDTEKQLQLDVDLLCRKIIAKSDEESKAVEQTLNEFFTRTATGWYHDRCDAEIQRYKANNSQKSQAGRASAEAREAKRQQVINGSAASEPTDGKRTNNGASTNQNQNQNQNQEPMNTEAAASLSPAKLPTCPHSNLIDIFCKQLPTLPRPRKEFWRGKKEADMRERWRWVLDSTQENGERYATTEAEALDWFSKFFAYVAKSDFLVSSNVCNLGWLMNAENFAKVIEGNFENRGAE